MRGICDQVGVLSLEFGVWSFRRACAMIVNVKGGEAAEKQRQRMRDFQNRRRAAGLCVDCGQPKPPERYSTCLSCALKRKRWAHEKYAMDREIGLCTRCEKNAAREGMGLCLSCALILSEKRRKKKEGEE